MPGDTDTMRKPPKELLDLRSGATTFDKLFPNLVVNNASPKDVYGTPHPSASYQKSENSTSAVKGNIATIDQMVDSSHSTDISVWILPLIGSILILLFSMIVILYFKRRRKTHSSKNESNVEYAMRKHFEMKDLNIDVFMDTVGTQLPAHHIIDYKNISIIKIIGEGYFGLVYSAQLRRKNQKAVMKIAVKQLKDVQSTYKSFLDEGQMMLKFKHPNILELEGFSFLPDRTPLIVTPFMENGSLSDYLESEVCDSANFIRFCKEVCSGMMYMHSLHYVHRDLAARNCMLDSSLTIKICDFGLTRSFETYVDGYCQRAPGPIAIQWMPIEIFTAAIQGQPLEFTYACDIWAFGVLMYEIFTKGYKPYSKMSPSQIAEFLFAGNRLDQPALCENKYYDIMMRCWATVADERPGFHVLYHVFKMNITHSEVTSSVGHSNDNINCTIVPLSPSEEASDDSGTQLVANTSE